MFSSFEKVRNGPVDVFIGKNGLTEGSIKHILTLLQQKKILKIKVQPEVAREHSVDKFVFEILEGIKKVLILDVRGHTIIIGKKAIPGLTLPKKYFRAKAHGSDDDSEEDEEDEDEIIDEDAILEEEASNTIDEEKTPQPPILVPQKHTYSDDDHIDYSDEALLDKLDDDQNPLTEEEYNKLIQQSKEKRAKGKKSPATKREKKGTPHPALQESTVSEEVSEAKIIETDTVDVESVEEEVKPKKKSSKKSSKSKASSDESKVPPLEEAIPSEPIIEETDDAPKKKSAKKSTKKSSKKSAKATEE